MSDKKTAAASTKAAEATPALTIGFSTQVEKLAALQLRNRYLWLALGAGMYLILQLSWWAAKYPARFDTLALMGHIGAILHATLIAAALIVALATPMLQAAWSKSMPGRPFSYVAAGLAAPLVLSAVYLLLTIPIILLHRYPELQAEAGVSIPLMVLQRGALLLCFALVLHNIVLVLRYNLRWHWTLCGALALALHIWLCYSLTYLSFTTEFFRQLNDLFYFNQLWRYIPAFPRLERPQIFHNMQGQFLPFFISVLLLCGLSILLWLPRAVQLGSKEAREQ